MTTNPASSMSKENDQINSSAGPAGMQSVARETDGKNCGVKGDTATTISTTGGADRDTATTVSTTGGAHRDTAPTISTTTPTTSTTRCCTRTTVGNANNITETTWIRVPGDSYILKDQSVIDRAKELFSKDLDDFGFKNLARSGDYINDAALITEKEISKQCQKLVSLIGQVGLEYTNTIRSFREARIQEITSECEKLIRHGRRGVIFNTCDKWMQSHQTHPTYVYMIPRMADNIIKDYKLVENKIRLTWSEFNTFTPASANIDSVKAMVGVLTTEDRR